MQALPNALRREAGEDEMSPENRDDGDNPAGNREGEQPRSRAGKSGKTKASPSQTDTSPRAAPAGEPGPDTESEQSRRQEAGGSSVAERPPRATAKRASGRVAGSEST